MAEVTIRHPDIDGFAHVAESALPFLGEGWEVVDDEVARLLTADEVAELKANDLVAYLSEHPDDRDRVRIIEEQRDTPRPTVLKATEQPAPEPEPSTDQPA